jgi:hypothetical protein
MQLSRRILIGLCSSIIQYVSSSTAQLFSNSSISIPEAPSTHQLPLSSNPLPDILSSPARQRFSRTYHNGTGSETVNTIFSGVYPVLNLTWFGTSGSSQQFISYIDTGSADTWAVSKNFQCISTTGAPLPQSSCGFGPLVNPALATFQNITSQEFNIQYFPEGYTLSGSMGYANLGVGGLTVSNQEVALITETAYTGNNITSSLLGLAYPAITAATYRSNSSQVGYSPIFTSMITDKIVSSAVFTLAIDRVPRDTSPSVAAGQIAFGGLVSPSYYYPPFTSVDIEVTDLYVPYGIQDLSFYTISHEFLYGLKNGTLASGGTYQSIIDSGTSGNFVPSPAAADINAQFSPPGVYNETLGYWVVDCEAVAPFAAFKIGGKVMPMDKRDMIVRSLNGLPGFEDVCFSAFADGGSVGEGLFIIGAVWLRNYVVAFDVGRSMLHFANRSPY